MFSMKVTSYLLISLILYQSFSAVANTLDFHTIDSEHLSEVHEHQFGDNTPTDKIEIHSEYGIQASIDGSSNEMSHNPADCHHCGHCHGTHAQWLGSLTSIELTSITTLHDFYYLSKVIDGPVTQLLRPPIA
ncbi:hypothetical protein [Paraglaciecola sp.]|uniref:hypothetical protein n=1 Tax=Paraglaciecola sp. TaxID=1920173 RepID=UPI002594ACB8|nr:hypothetical protein [uncultured Paraglaciecola sp.]